MTRNLLKERFEEKFITEPNIGCWLWIASKNNKGYGEISIKGKTMKAHRVSYELYKGNIPLGLCVCHICDIPSCVNPDHLFLGTHSDNMKDRQVKSRNPLTKFGEDNLSSVLKSEQVIEIRNKYIPRKYSIRMLAKEYNVSFQLIQKIVTRQIWVGHK